MTTKSKKKIKWRALRVGTLLRATDEANARTNLRDLPTLNHLQVGSSTGGWCPADALGRVGDKVQPKNGLLWRRRVAKGA